MAEIDVQKKSSNIWPWILGLVVLGIVIWMLVGGSDSTDMSGTPQDIPAAEQPASPPTTTQSPSVMPLPDTTATGTGTGY